MINNNNVTGLILAGGAGRRTGGQDKGLLHWRGKPLVSHVLERLQQQTGEVIISCNRNFDDYRNFSCPIIADQREDFPGPLAGIEAAIPHLKRPYLAVVACDIPRLPVDLVARLLEPLSTGGGASPMVSVAHDGQREQYLCAVMNIEYLASLPEFLKQGHRAVKHWYQQSPHVVVDFSDQYEAFRNHNYLDDSRKQ